LRWSAARWFSLTDHLDRSSAIEREGLSRRMSTQAILANLLASATTTVLWWHLSSKPRSHTPSGVSLFANEGSAALAPWISNVCR